MIDQMSVFDIDEPDSSHARAQRAMLDVWKRTLDQIPTQFGRLVYLAELRNDNSGRYQHFGLAQLYGEDESNRVLRSSHEKVFGEWLTYSLEGQRADLEAYFDGLEDDCATVLQTWGALEPYVKLPPEAAGDAERLLFSSDLEIILELIRRESSGERGGAAPDRE